MRATIVTSWDIGLANVNRLFCLLTLCPTLLTGFLLVANRDPQGLHHLKYTISEKMLMMSCIC